MCVCVYAYIYVYICICVGKSNKFNLFLLFDYYPNYKDAF